MYNIHNRVKKENIAREQKKEIENTYFERHLKNIIKYKPNIIEITKAYIENPMKDIHMHSNMNLAFFNYTKACIEHFEKTFESTSSDESDDDNFLFDPYTELKKPEVLLHSCFTPLKIYNGTSEGVPLEIQWQQLPNNIHRFTIDTQRARPETAVPVALRPFGVGI